MFLDRADNLVLIDSWKQIKKVINNSIKQDMSTMPGITSGARATKPSGAAKMALILFKVRTAHFFLCK